MQIVISVVPPNPWLPHVLAFWGWQVVTPTIHFWRSALGGRATSFSGLHMASHELPHETDAFGQCSRSHCTCRKYSSASLCTPNSAKGAECHVEVCPPIHWKSHLVVRITASLKSCNESVSTNTRMICFTTCQSHALMITSKQMILLNNQCPVSRIWICDTSISFAQYYE